MKHIAEELQAIIDYYFPLLKAVSENEFAFKPLVEKWSKKEMIGHLIDSAQNNIRRFIVSQYEEQPTILYNQDKWVTINNYQFSLANDLVNLWYLLNKQAASILMNTSEEMAQRYSNTDAAHTIEWLAGDYIKHLKHHINFVLDLEPVAYP